MKLDCRRIINMVLFLQIICSLFGEIFYSLNEKFSIIFYIPDLLNLVMLFILFIMTKGTFNFNKKNLSTKLIIVFLGYTIMSFIWSTYNVYDAISRFRYIFGGVITFIVCNSYLEDKMYEKIINFMCYIQVLNLFLVIYQNLIMNFHPDFCNGIFGYVGYNNGIQGFYCLMISIVSMVYYIDGIWKKMRSIIMIGISCVICAFAEIKIFYIVLVISILSILFFKNKNKKERIRIIQVSFSIIILLIIAYQILIYVLPDNLYTFFNIDGALAYEARSTYAGRTNTISYVYNNVFHNDFFNAMFGTGLGSSSSEYIYELGKSFSDFGFIGLSILCGTFVNVFSSSRNVSSEAFISAMVSIVIILSIIVWNCTFTRGVYIVFFFLGFRNVSGFQNKKGDKKWINIKFQL